MKKKRKLNYHRQVHNEKRRNCNNSPITALFKCQTHRWVSFGRQREILLSVHTHWTTSGQGLSFFAVDQSVIIVRRNFCRFFSDAYISSSLFQNKKRQISSLLLASFMFFIKKKWPQYKENCNASKWKKVLKRYGWHFKLCWVGFRITFT